MGAGLGGESRTAQTFCGTKAKTATAGLDTGGATAKSVATMGATEGMLQTPSQPSIIMQPGRIMPAGPARTHRTKTSTIETRWKVISSDYYLRCSLARQGFPVSGERDNTPPLSCQHLSTP